MGVIILILIVICVIFLGAIFNEADKRGGFKAWNEQKINAQQELETKALERESAKTVFTQKKKLGMNVPEYYKKQTIPKHSFQNYIVLKK